MRLAYLVTHPIQYQAPLLRRIAAEPDIKLKVFFASDLSVHGFLDSGFKRQIRWDVPLLDGYEYEFLPSFGSTDLVTFWRPISYGLAQRLKAGRFDALWVHGYMRWHHWIAMTEAKRNGMKVLMRDEATLISAPRGRLRRELKRPFFAWLRRIIDRFLAIGSLNASYYRKHGIRDADIFMMPYAVDNAFFRARITECASQREVLRATLGLQAGRPVILYAGKFAAHKRPDDLLEAYIHLSPNGQSEPRPYLIYVGDGAQRSQLEARAAENGWKSIRFLGFRNQTEMPAYYDLCDVFVMPSTIEPWGLVVNEAMNAGKAIIASDRAGCAPDLVHDCKNGFVFRAGDVADLGRVLREVLASPARWTEMGRRSLEVINHWSFEEDVLGLRAALDL
jgi:glycosyltransferase involved in cell wall biosynthesis